MNNHDKIALRFMVLITLGPIILGMGLGSMAYLAGYLFGLCG